MSRGGAVLLQLGEDAPIIQPPGFDPWIFDPALMADLAGAPLQNVMSDWPLIAQEMANNGIWEPECAAGAVGTIGIETAHTFKPVREAFWLSEEWRRLNLWYWPFYGRGYVQTTHSYNYAALGPLVGLDLLADPDRALEPWVAAVGLASFFRSHNIHAVAREHNWTEVRRRVLGAAPIDDVRYITNVAETLLAA